MGRKLLLLGYLSVTSKEVCVYSHKALDFAGSLYEEWLGIGMCKGYSPPCSVDGIHVFHSVNVMSILTFSSVSYFFTELKE